MWLGIPYEGWASISGATMGIWSMLYFDVFGHWIHKYECVHRGTGQWPSYHECRSCGKRKVIRRAGEFLEKEQKWVDHEPMARPPWEMGPPPKSPFPKLEKAQQKHRYQISPNEVFVGTSEEYGLFLREKEATERSKRTQQLVREMNAAGGPYAYEWRQERERERERKRALGGVTVEEAARGLADAAKATMHQIWEMDAAEYRDLTRDAQEGVRVVEELRGDNGVIARAVTREGSDYDHDGDGIIHVAPLPVAEPDYQER